MEEVSVPDPYAEDDGESGDADDSSTVVMMAHYHPGNVCNDHCNARCSVYTS